MLFAGILGFVGGVVTSRLVSLGVCCFVGVRVGGYWWVDWMGWFGWVFDCYVCVLFLL